MGQFESGYTFTNGKPNDCNPTTLKKLIENAKAQAALIGDQSLKDTPTGNDLVLILDALNNTLRKTALSSFLLPSGIIIPFAGASAPGGWLLCAGQAVNRVTYGILFAAIGTTYGTGDGSTTFNVPDLRGRVPFGADNMLGTAANRAQVTTNMTTTAGSKVVTVSSMAGIASGMYVVHPNIQAGTTIAKALTATTFELSANATTSGTASGRASEFSDAQVIGGSGGAASRPLRMGETPPELGFGITYINPANAGGGGGARIGSLKINGVDYTDEEIALTTTLLGRDHGNMPPALVTNYIIKT